MAELTWNEFAPDLDPLTPGNITDMRGFRPSEKGVMTADSVVQIASPLNVPVVAAYSCFLLGTQVIIEATPPAVYIVKNGTPVTLNTGYSNSTVIWRFAPYGQDLIMVNGINLP